MLKARERVRGRKKPSLPRGMLRPWTTWLVSGHEYRGWERTYDATYGEEPDDDLEIFSELRGVCSLDSVYCDACQEVETDVDVENGGDANWSEEPDEDCLTWLFNLMNCLM